MAGIAASYVSATSFTVSGDTTDIFTVGRRVRCNCGASGIKTAPVVSSSYSVGDSLTTVVLDGSSLDANLIDVKYGVASAESIPRHSHVASDLPADLGGGNQVSILSASDLVTGDAVSMLANGAFEKVCSNQSLAGSGNLTPCFAGSCNFPRVAGLDETRAVVIISDGELTKYSAAVVSFSGYSPSLGSKFVVAPESGAVDFVPLDSSTVMVVAEEWTPQTTIGFLMFVSGTAITASTPVVLSGVNPYHSGAAGNVHICALDATTCVVVFSDASNSRRGTAVVLKRVEDTVQFGTPFVFDTDGIEEATQVIAMNSTDAVVFYKKSTTSPSYQGICRKLTVSGMTISASQAPVVFDASGDVNHFGATAMATNVGLVSYRRESVGWVYVVCVTISDGVLSAGTPVCPPSVVGYNGISGCSAITRVSDTQAVMIWQYSGASRLYRCLVTLTGTIPSGSLIAEYANDTSLYLDITTLPGTTTVVGIHRYEATYRPMIRAFDVGGIITATNYKRFIGLVASGAAAGNAVKLTTKGGIAGGLTGLTRGVAYYLTPAGALTTSGVAPSIPVGVAISDTQLLLLTDWHSQ